MRILHSLCFAISASVALACTGRVVPAQNARDLQLETYRQSFATCSEPQSDVFLGRVLGWVNRCDLPTEPHGPWGGYLQRAKDGRLAVIGSVRFSLHINPANPEEFLTEGIGRHIVYDNLTSELVASADYRIVDEGPIPLSQLDTGELIIRMKQRVVREFLQSRTRYSHEADVFARIHVEKIADGIYGIDYGREHDIGIPVRPMSPTDVASGQEVIVRTIGTMQFDAQLDGRKLIDLRHRRLVRDDYAEILRSSRRIQPSRNAWTVRWCSHSACDSDPDGSCAFVPDLQPAGVDYCASRRSP